jgi:colicin import membrane protein
MPKAVKAPVARPRRTKSEVTQEFADIHEQAEAARLSPDAKADEATRLREQEVRQSVEGVSIDTVVQQTSALGRDISKALSGLSEKLTAEVGLLSSLREAVALERKEIERLHKIDIAATAVDQLVQDYDRQKRELESEITEQRAVWDEEVRTHERERKEQEEALRKQRQREIEDYDYKRALDRKKSQDKYDEEIRIQEKKNLEGQESLEKSWTQSEAALKEREEDLARLRKQVETFPARLKQEAEAAAKEAVSAAEVRYKQDTIILQKDAEAEKRMAALQIRTLEETVAHQAAQMTALQAQVDDAKRQVQDIAVKAIEGASGARALSHINQIAMEQAKNRPQS